MGKREEDQVREAFLLSDGKLEVGYKSWWRKAKSNLGVILLLPYHRSIDDIRPKLLHPQRVYIGNILCRQGQSIEAFTTFTGCLSMPRAHNKAVFQGNQPLPAILLMNLALENRFEEAR